ncbi:MAG: ABC transporter permease [Oscillospiraceae bacterium]
MRLFEILRLVWVNILANKFKVILTSLGVIVGAATIVMVIAIGKGGEATIKDQFADLSADTLYVNPDYAKDNLDFAKLPKFSLDMLEVLREECPSLSLVTLRTSVYPKVQVGSTNENRDVTAVTPDYSEIANLKISAGDNIDDIHMDEESRVAVIGHEVAVKEFGDAENAVGETLRIAGKKYTIIGVLARKGDSMQGLSADDGIFVPYTVAEKYLIEDYNTPQLTARTGNVKTIDMGKAELMSVLEYLWDDESKNFIVEDAGSRIDAATASARTMSALLIAVAAIVFLVGGIGIMNVLFVSVKERTREIGVLKALGCAQKDILLQFLAESVMLSVFGGIAGVVMGNALLPIIAKFDMRVIFSLGGSLVAMIFAIITGTVFGFYPALQASRLKPIDALNQD